MAVRTGSRVRIVPGLLRLCLVLLPVLVLAAPPDEPAIERTGIATLEDLFGTTGNKFAGAIGFQVRESNRYPEAVAGYGIGIDDVVVEWRESTLVEDTTECGTVCVGGARDGQPCNADTDCEDGIAGFCGGGSCATVNLSQNNFFEGNASIGITVSDPSPSGNDCNLDGVVDTPDDYDCDDDGAPDVVVQVRSPEDVEGEWVVLNAIGPSATVFKGSVLISSTIDAPGTVFIATRGNDDPTVVATYLDLDDGTGRPCQGSVDPDAWGRVEMLATVFLTPGRIAVTRSKVMDNGDHDGWADSGETVSLAVELSNKVLTPPEANRGWVPWVERGFKRGFDVTGVKLYLSSEDPSVACITRPVIEFGDLAVGETRFSTQTFEFIIDTSVDRTDALEDLTATLRINIEANEFDNAWIPQTLTLDLDLDAFGGRGPTTFFEGFEGGFGAFTTMHLDEPLNPPASDLGNREAGVVNADGWRCQYSDPDWEGAASFGNSAGSICFPNPNGAPDAFYFQEVTDRAFSGTRSLGYNIFLDQARGYTTPNSQLEAVRTIDPINLGWSGVCAPGRSTTCTQDADCADGETCEISASTLSFKHQVSNLDFRSVGAQFGRSADRDIVAVQLAGDDGAPVGPWIKINPFINLYDSQANSNYFNCSFDPADDGNTEEDFFDPADPRRRHGPSSTCAPEFSFAHQGDTDAPFDPTRLGKATDGPGLEGSTGIGTWVEPVFDLNRFRGRRLRLRFLQSGLKLGGSVHWEQAFAWNPDPGDDGWFIDDVTVTDTLTTPGTLIADQNDNSELPDCEDRVCGASGGVDAVVATYPASGTAAPGHVLELDASASSVDACGGVLHYRFWVEGDGDPAFNPAVDVLLRDWTENPLMLDTPRETTDYAVSVRCATDPECLTTRIVTGVVNCPASGNLTVPGHDNAFLHRAPRNRRNLALGGTLVDADKEVTLYWTTGATVDVIRGDLRALRADEALGGSEVCVADNRAHPSQLTDIAPTPEDGDGHFWLLRSAPACNVSAAGGSYGLVGEAVDRIAVLATCPD